MVRIIFIVATLVFSVVAKAQTSYEKEMKNALELLDNGKFEEAGNQFEKIAETEKENWLPNYYVALSNTFYSFSVSDKKQKADLLEKSEKFLKKSSENQSENVEIMVVQALIDTGWIVYEPMIYGQQNFGKVLETYTKAKQIDPKNPRVALSSVQFDMNSAKYMGRNPKDFCKDLEKVIELFATFKPETEFSPNWGLKNTQELVQQCNQ